MSKQTGISRNIFANVLIPYRTLIKGSGYTRKIIETCSTLFINPQAPVAQKIADEMVFRHFQGEGVEFF